LEKYENELCQFILQIIFGSIFKIYHDTPILWCTTTDLGMFGVAFARALHMNLVLYISRYLVSGSQPFLANGP